MSYLVARFGEATSRVLLAGLGLMVLNVATDPQAWAPGCLPMWLGLVKAVGLALLGVLTPEATAAGLPANPSQAGPSRSVPAKS